VTVTFADAEGLLPDQTQVRYRGAQVGIVRSVKLSADRQRVEVRARLDSSAAGLACDGSQFWIVRPQVTPAGLHGLQTIVSGSYLQVEPGNGKRCLAFTGSEQAALPPELRTGLVLRLTTPHIGTLNTGAPVYHRGLEVGSVESLALNDDATAVNIQIRIDRRYATLVRQNSVFWNAGGLDVSLKLTGITATAESVRSLLVGGIAFANPQPAGPLALAEAVFALHDKPEEKWLTMETAIPGWAGLAGPPTNTPRSTPLTASSALSTNVAR
jgi:paraquat-inducible protein B